MSASANPDIVDDGLVFLYDTDDGKSYKGEPTENIALTEMGISLGQNFSSGQYFCTTSIVNFSQAKYGNGVVWKYAIDRNNDRNWLRSPYSSASGGSTWTFSYWVYNPNSINVTMQARIFGLDSNSTIVTNQTNNITCQSLTWTQVYLTTALAATATQIGFHLELINEEDFSVNDFVYLDGIQLEEKSHVTQFTTGTRSATQGLIDRTGNSTIDLSDVSFDSNAQMTFDGTDDYIPLTGNILNVDAFTVEAVVNITSTGNYNKPIFVAGNLSNSGIWFFKHRSGLGNRLVMHGYDGVNPRIDVVSVNQVPDAQNTYVAVTFDGSAYQLYMNGELEGSPVVDNKVGATTTNYIGKQSSIYLDGDIPTMKIYNKALTPDEILQNFNATKSRFGL